MGMLGLIRGALATPIELRCGKPSNFAKLGRLTLKAF